jgi:hypothetical protein
MPYSQATESAVKQAAHNRKENLRLVRLWAQFQTQDLPNTKQ